MGLVRAVRGSEIPAGPVTGGLVRRGTQVDERVWAGEGRSKPESSSGWHHHGGHFAYVYVVEGQVRIEWGPGGREIIDLSAGDFYVISPDTIHREGNPGHQDQVLAIFGVGSGPAFVEVDEPEPEE